MRRFPIPFLAAVCGLVLFCLAAAAMPTPQPLPTCPAASLTPEDLAPQTQDLELFLLAVLERPCPCDSARRRERGH
jgi:hypothetical protein